jgi:hypothetical protein
VAQAVAVPIVRGGRDPCGDGLLHRVAGQEAARNVLLTDQEAPAMA